MKITEIEIIRKPGKKTEYSAKITNEHPEDYYGNINNHEEYINPQNNEAMLSNMSTNMGISQPPLAYGYPMYPYGYPYPCYEYGPAMMQMNDMYDEYLTNNGYLTYASMPSNYFDFSNMSKMQMEDQNLVKMGFSHISKS